MASIIPTLFLINEVIYFFVSVLILIQILNYGQEKLISFFFNKSVFFAILAK